MKLLKPGDPCPCCGRPIPEGLPEKRMLLLSWLAEGMALKKQWRVWSRAITRRLGHEPKEELASAECAGDSPDPV